MLVLGNQGSHGAIVRAKIFLRHALNVFFGDGRVVFRGIENFAVVAKKHFVRPDGIRSPIDRPHLLVELNKADVLCFLKFLVRDRRLLYLFQLVENGSFAFLRIDTLLRLRDDYRKQRIESRLLRGAYLESDLILVH